MPGWYGVAYIPSRLDNIAYYTSLMHRCITKTNEIQLKYEPNIKLVNDASFVSLSPAHPTPNPLVQVSNRCDHYRKPANRMRHLV